MKINRKNYWNLRDIIFLCLISIFFGVIYQGWNYAYYFIASTPLKPYANDLTLGVWLMAGPLSAILFKKRGACFLGEFLASIVEMFLFSSWGISTVICGIIQGIGSELGFAITKYKHFDKIGVLTSIITSTIITFIWDLFQSGYLHYPFKMLISLFIIRLLSIGTFSGILVLQINRLLIKSGVFNNYGN